MPIAHRHRFEFVVLAPPAATSTTTTGRHGFPVSRHGRARERPGLSEFWRLACARVRVREAGR